VNSDDPTQEGFFNLTDLPDDITRAIAQVAIEWSDLESAVERIIWLLAEIPRDTFGACITTHMNITGRMEVVLALADHRHPGSQITSDLIKLVEVTRKKLSPLRNAIIHGRWVSPLAMYGDHYASVSMFQARGELKSTSRAWTAPMLRNVFERIARATRQYRLILGRFREAAPQAKPGGILVAQIQVPARDS
jgi:hypothetical protein